MSANTNPLTSPQHQSARQIDSRQRWPGANLLRNPFGELTRSERAELAVVDITKIIELIGKSPSTAPSGGGNWAEPIPDAFAPFTAYQLIGECGRGKTTRMLAIAKRFPSASYVYLPEDGICPAIPEGDPLLIDEAQRLPWRIRRRIFATGVTMVLGTHRDLTRPLRRAGYQVATERIGLSLSADKLAEILNRRINASRRDVRQPSPQVGVDVAARLIERFGTDIRGIESYLYDVVQSQEHDHGEMRFIG